MKQRLAIFRLKLKVSLLASLKVFMKPHYLLGAVIAMFLVANLIIWSLNLELAQYIISEPSLSIASKLEFFSSSIRDIFTTYESNQALGIAVFSVMFGINIALLVFVLRNIGLKKMAKQSGASGTGLVFAVLSGGCVACGTSLLAPLAITFGATSGTFLRDVSLLLNWISSILILFSIYQLGQLAATARSKN
jgi:hypothetical protein